MKKIGLYAAALTLVLAGCDKDPYNGGQGGGPSGEGLNMITETITAYGGVNGKAAIANNLTFSWTTGDRIAIHTDNAGGSYYTSDAITDIDGICADFTVSLSGSRNGYAVYPASVASTPADYGQDASHKVKINLPSSYTITSLTSLESPLPMIARDNGGDLYFNHVGALLRLSLNQVPPETAKIVVTFDKDVTGEFSVPNGTTPGTADCIISTSSATSRNTVTFTGLGSLMGGEWRNGVILNIPVPTGEYDGLTVAAYDSSDDEITSLTRASFSWTAQRAHGRKYTIALFPLFSVDDEGTSVAFSPGNLQYNPAYDEWQFAPAQYDCIGDDNENIADDYNGWIDLFGWGTSGAVFGSGYGSAYQPWSTDDVDTNYGPQDGIGGNYSLTSSFANGDWGVFHSASGGSTKKIYGGGSYNWRTLSYHEWNYLLYERTCRTTGMPSEGKFGDNTNVRFISCDLNGQTKGTIIFPDDYCHPDDVDILDGYTYNSFTTAYAYIQSLADWDKMESAGAVFLPHAGIRLAHAIDDNVTSIYIPSGLQYVHSFAYYWTSSDWSHFDFEDYRSAIEAMGETVERFEYLKTTQQLAQGIPDNGLATYGICCGDSEIANDFTTGALPYRSIGGSVRLVRNVGASNDRSMDSGLDSVIWDD